MSGAGSDARSGAAMLDVAASAEAPATGRPNLYLVVGAVFTAAAIALAIVGTVWTPYPPTAVDLLHRSAGPTLQHLLGTDQFGRDVLSRVMAGGWRSLSLGFGAT